MCHCQYIRFIFGRKWKLWETLQNHVSGRKKKKKNMRSSRKKSQKWRNPSPSRARASNFSKEAVADEDDRILDILDSCTIKVRICNFFCLVYLIVKHEKIIVLSDEPWDQVDLTSQGTDWVVGGEPVPVSVLPQIYLTDLVHLGTKGLKWLVNWRSVDSSLLCS